MTQNFFERPFGFNIKLPGERVIQQGRDTAVKVVKGLNPFGEYYEQNKQVFSGDVYNEFDKLSTLYFNVDAAMRNADKNLPVSFDMQG